MNINQADVDRVKKRLEVAVKDALTEKDAKAIMAEVQGIILLRTRKGKFLEGSKTPAKYSAGHARLRKKLGLPTERVTLFMGDVGVLESIKGKAESNNTELTLEVGYLENSEARARQIGIWLDDEGAGKTKVRYRHIGLTDAESDRVISNLKTRIGKSINRANT